MLFWLAWLFLMQLEFTPLEFETLVLRLLAFFQVILEFTPLEFETEYSFLKGKKYLN